MKISDFISKKKIMLRNIRNINVNKVVSVKGFSVMVSLSEKSKGSNLKESIDFRVRTEG